MSSTSSDDEGLPWYVKAMLALTLLVILFVVGIDLLKFAQAF
jgi:hypothetical protein